MGFSKGNNSSESVERKLYKGVGSFYVVGVNPNKQELEKIYGVTLDKEPEYLGEQESDGKKVKTVRISYCIKSDGAVHVDAAGNPIELITNHTFFLRNEPNRGSESGKYQIVDAYGNFAWADEETIKAGEIPQYKNGAATIHKGYRVAYVGEQALTEFLMKYMCVPSSVKWIDGKPAGWVDNLSDCESRLDHIKDYFSGNVSELKTILSYQPNNKVKIAVGVKVAKDGRQLQATYTGMCLTNATSKYNKLDASIKASSSTSSNPIDFTGDGNKSTIGELSEYVVTPTNFNQGTPASTDNPFGDEPNELPFG